jgi:hypothetical protein
MQVPGTTHNEVMSKAALAKASSYTTGATRADNRAMMILLLSMQP